MKKIIALVLALVMCLSVFAACGKKNATTGNDEKTGKGATLAEVKAAGKLTVATSPDFAPFESLENNQVVGIEVDILSMICMELGVELEIAQMDFDSVLAGIQAAKYDCGMAGITVDKDRQKNMLFSDVYYNAAQVIVVKEDSSIKDKADLKNKTVSAQTGTTAESGCADAGCTVKGFNANADAKAALTTGKVDAWVVDNLTAMQMVEEGDGLKILEEKLTEEPYAFAFAFGSEDLVTEINKILNKLIDDGTIEKVFSNYDETYVKP